MGYFLDKLYPRDVLDKIDIRDVSCILYQDVIFSHFYSFEVLLLKDI